MSNRGYSSYNNRRRPKKRITGRFYAFLTILTVLVVMLGVLISSRGSRDVTGGVNGGMNGGAANGAANGAAQLTPAPAPSAWPDGAETPAPATPGENTAMTIEEMLENNPDLAPLEGDQKVKVDNLAINESLPDEWHNILLLGSDTRNVKKVSRTDTIMIASINVKDGRIKLISIMRDTIVPIPGHGEKKITSASYYGGPELVMRVVNECFKLNISEYVLVNFASFKEVIDILGGIELDVTQSEMEQVNKNIQEQAQVLKMSREKFLAGEYNLKTFGPETHMDGLQALAYSRIRKIDNDYQRTERQRMVIDAAIQKFRGSVSVTQLIKLATSMWQHIDTNVDMMGAIGLATTVLRSGIGDVQNGLMPISKTYVSERRSANGSALYDVDFEANAARLYKYIYEE